jgi:hypothetical protein
MKIPRDNKCVHKILKKLCKICYPVQCDICKNGKDYSAYYYESRHIPGKEHTISEFTGVPYHENPYYCNYLW